MRTAVVLLACGLSGCYSWGDPDLKVTVRGDGVSGGMVAFRGRFTRMVGGQDDFSHVNRNYMLRLAMGGELLVRAKQDYSQRLSDECYGVTLDDGIAVRRASVAEWEEAEALRVAGSVRPRGRVAEGDYSPNLAWSALTTYRTARVIERPSIGFLGGDIHLGPTLFELRDAGSGELVFSAQTGRGDHHVSGLDQWFGDRYYLHALGERRVLLVELPARGPYPQARLATVSDRAVDDDGDGLAERLVVTVRAEVVTEGVIRAVVTLEAVGGTITKVAKHNVTPGLAEVEVAFAGEQLHEKLGEDGPWRIESLSLGFETYDFRVPLEYLEDAGETGEYSLANFSRRP
jgi:hypothetical protein